MTQRPIEKFEQVLREAVQIEITLFAPRGGRREIRRVPKLFGASAELDRTTMELVIRHPSHEVAHKITMGKMRRDQVTPDMLKEERIPFSRIAYLAGHHTNSTGHPTWVWYGVRHKKRHAYELTERGRPTGERSGFETRCAITSALQPL